MDVVNTYQEDVRVVRRLKEDIARLSEQLTEDVRRLEQNLQLQLAAIARMELEACLKDILKPHLCTSISKASATSLSSCLVLREWHGVCHLNDSQNYRIKGILPEIPRGDPRRVNETKMIDSKLMRQALTDAMAFEHTRSHNGYDECESC